MKTILSTLAFCLLLVTVSCDETQKVINTASNVQLNGNYTITDVMSKKYAAKGLTVTFDALNKSFSATTDCNNLFGSYTIDMYAIKFGNIASTKKFCEGKMDSETELTQAFEATGSYTVENGVLKLYASTDRSLLLTATKVRETNEN